MTEYVETFFTDTGITDDLRGNTSFKIFIRDIVNMYGKRELGVIEDDTLGLLDNVDGSNIGVSNGSGSVQGDGRHDNTDKETLKLLSDSERTFLEHVIGRCHTSSQTSNGTYISDVIQCGSEKHAFEYSKTLREFSRTFARTFFIVSVHDKHIHVIHDCAFSDGTCRCHWKKQTQTNNSVVLRRPLQGRKRHCPLRGLTLADWENIFLYFATNGREIVSASISGLMEEIQDVCKNMAQRRPSGCQTSGTLEKHCEGIPSNLRRPESLPSGSETVRGQDGELHNKQKKARSNKCYDKFSQILQFLELNPMCPVINFVDHPKYLDSKLAEFRSDNFTVRNVVDVFSKKVMTWNIQDFFDFYTKDGCNPIFSAGYGNVNDVYYDLEDSTAALVELVKFQFNNNDDAILDFMTSLYNILERVVPKCNTMLIHSPPSAGKNFFFDAVCDYFLSKGQLGRANKHNNFAFQDAYGRRIIMWNEPNYESAMTDQLKMMTAGDSYTVTVKNKPDAAVYKTPLIILTNNNIPLMNDPCFKDRIKQFRWKTAPFLKDYNKKPYPLAVYYMFLQYGLIKETN